MRVLLIQSHPDSGSFSAAVAAAFRRGAMQAGHEVDIADLVAEGFEPRFLQGDLDCYHGKGAVPDDILREQARIDRADALVLVFPVYWWSLPALLKGWIDRVFIGGWAFKFENGAVVGTMRDIPVRLLGVGGGNDAGYTKHGYYQAFESQVYNGIFRFCGIKRLSAHILLESESAQPEKRHVHLAKAFDLGKSLV